MTSKLRRLFETHGLMSMNKQRFLSAVLGPHSCQFDSQAGQLQFSTGLSLAVQVLGEETGPPNKRVWCWSHADAQLSPELRVAAERLKTIGETEGIEEFVVPKLPAERVENHVLAFVALGLLEAPAFYRAVLGETATVYLIQDPEFPEVPPPSATGFVATMSEAISSYDFRNHKEAVASLLDQLRWSPRWTPSGFEVVAADGATVLGFFDERDRLHKLSTRAAQPQPS
jgi:hypothetical protein